MATPLKVLIAEDSQDDAELMVRELRRAGFVPEWKRVETETDFLAELKNLPDIVLSDYAMPQFNGLRAAELVRASGWNIPFILISGTMGEETAVEAMRQGATDYLLKDRIARLGSAVKRALEQKQLLAERKRAGAALTLFRTLIDRSSDAIEVIDPETGRYLDVNETACQRLGFTRDEMLSLTVPEVETMAVDFSTWRNNVEEIRRTGFKVFEGRHRRKDGSTFPIEVNVRYVRLDRDYLIASVRDITERKKFEDEVALREHRLNMFFTGASAGLVLLDKDLRYVQINDTLAEINGIPVKEHLGRTIRETIPELAPLIEPVLKKVLATGEPVLNMDLAGETKKFPGVVRHWVESFFPITGKDGRPEAVGGIVVEVTERKRVENALRESEEKFRQIAENINEVFWITDPAKFKMIYISPAYEKIWGRTCESLYESPQTWLDAIHPDDCKRIVQALTAKQAKGEYDEIYRILRPDGSERWIHEHAFPLRNAAGEVFRIVGTAEDITENRKLEAQFRQSQKMESIGQLAGGIAHDFNNILFAITGNLHLVKLEAGDNPVIAEHLEELSNATQRAADLVNQILTFSRQNKQDRSPIHLNHVALEALKLLRASVPATIRIQTELTETPTVLANATAIHQVIMNLGTNAWHAMRNNPGTLKVEMDVIEADEELVRNLPDLRPGKYVRLFVSDTGCGMDRVTLDRIFDPFFTTKPVGEGTGLGLAVVHGIIKNHDGGISVHSQPGEGTTFQLYFPVFETDAVVEKIESAPVPRGQGEHILLVDDEEVLTSLGKKILERLGYWVTIKNNPQEAAETVRVHPEEFDLVITDLTMPVMDGAKLGGQLLQIRPGLPIILMTGYSGAMTPEKVRELGFRELLDKPCNAQDLSEAVYRVLHPPAETQR